MCEEQQGQVIEFVPLRNFQNDYEILNSYPFTIRKKSNHYEVKEYIENNGYVRINLKGKTYCKHRLIALQFLPNDNPLNKNDVDHINQDKDDYHIENLRWVSHSKNCKNRTSYKGVFYNYVDDIPDESMVVDFYETKNARHEFEGYYYYEGVFYYDNDINYRILNVNETKSKNKFVAMTDIYGKQVNVCINRFLLQHDML